MLQLDTKKNEIATGFFNESKKDNHHQKGIINQLYFHTQNFVLL
jgi:hypothetical protein